MSEIMDRSFEGSALYDHGYYKVAEISVTKLWDDTGGHVTSLGNTDITFISRLDEQEAGVGLVDNRFVDIRAAEEYYFFVADRYEGWSWFEDRCSLMTQGLWVVDGDETYEYRDPTSDQSFSRHLVDSFEDKLDSVHGEPELL